MGLAPMDGVTDAAMRYMTAKYSAQNNKSANSNNQTGGIDIMFTEFVSVDALANVKEKDATRRVLQAFVYGESERPIVAQVFGHEPELFYQAAVIVAELGFDGIDINMGCPAKSVEQHGSGAGLIRTPEIAQEVIRHAKRGVEEWAAGRVGTTDLAVSEEVKGLVGERRKDLGKDRKELPVSVKTRIGVDGDVSEWWMEILMEATPAIITVHGRTLKQLYRGSADWEALGRAAEVVHRAGGVFFGNGDVMSVQEACEKYRRYGVDGVLIGRAAQGNPLFAKSGVGEASRKQKMVWMIEHAEKYEELFPGEAFFPMRKHLAWYARGFPGASELRGELVRCNSAAEVKKVLAGV